MQHLAPPSSPSVALLVGALLLAVGCDESDPTTDAAAPVRDDGVVGAVDTGSPDAGPRDAGPPPGGEVAEVLAEATFEVRVTEDLAYGQGLSHDAEGGEEGRPMDLLLDVYEPVREDDVRMPVMVMIHGGGFVNGSHKHLRLSAMAEFFASRGWVAFSITYRLARHRGTLPTDYPAPPAGSAPGQFNALYPACRDAKAAIRWVRAHADEYALHPDYITAVGGSAGSFIAMALGASDESDCRDEVSAAEDRTLAGTNLEQSSAIATIIDHWGGVAILDVLEAMHGQSRFDAADAPASIVHGTEDPTVLFGQAEIIRDEYERTGVLHAFHPLEGLGHGPWSATIDGETLSENAFGFVVESQRLTVR